MAACSASSPCNSSRQDAARSIALVPHNPSANRMSSLSSMATIFSEVVALDVVPADPDEAVGFGLEGVDADAWLVEAHSPPSV